MEALPHLYLLPLPSRHARHGARSCVCWGRLGRHPSRHARHGAHSCMCWGRLGLHPSRHARHGARSSVRWGRLRLHHPCRHARHGARSRWRCGKLRLHHPSRHARHGARSRWRCGKLRLHHPSRHARHAAGPGRLSRWRRCLQGKVAAGRVGRGRRIARALRQAGTANPTLLRFLCQLLQCGQGNGRSLNCASPPHACHGSCSLLPSGRAKGSAI